MSKHRLGRTDNPTTGRGEGAPEGLQRIEVITGVGRRRRWSPEAKAHIVLESRQPGAVVSEVARRHGLSPQQLFGWRRKLRQAAEVATATTSAFTPVVVAAEGASRTGRGHTEAYARPITERAQVEIT